MAADVVKIGPATLYRGDCRDVLPTLDEVDSVVTDPPYADETHEGARTDIDTPLVTFESITADDLRAVFGSCGRLVRRWVVASVGWRHILPMEQEPPEGLRFVRFGIWVKPNGVPQFTGDRPATGWEAIAVLHKAGVKMRWNGGGHHAVWIENKINGPHPTCKPRRLVEKWLNLFTDKGESVLDPFMGSGTTGVACVRLGRRFIGIEKDSGHFATACKRIKEAWDAEKSSLFPAQAADAV